MNFAQAEVEIKSYVESQWALSAYSTLPIFWENEEWKRGVDRFLYVNIEGIFADKTIFGGSGKRMSIESGIVFFHSFVEKGAGKQIALLPVVALTQILEIKSIASVIDMDGGAPPSPVDEDTLVSGRPGGNYYRCSGSVPFIVRSSI
jgi:hypothetical protein